MNLTAGIKTWGAAALGAASLLLVANLVAQYRGLHSEKSLAHPITASGQASRIVRSSSHAADDLLQYDPKVHLDALKQLDSRPLPDEDRNPFQSAGGITPPPNLQASGPASKTEAPPPAAPAPPPPPPPPPLKAMGYNELPGGKKEAMVTFNDDLVVVHEGDIVGAKFKVVKINPSMVVVEDGDTHQNIELPFPQ